MTINFFSGLRFIYFLHRHYNVKKERWNVQCFSYSLYWVWSIILLRKWMAFFFRFHGHHIHFLVPSSVHLLICASQRESLTLHYHSGMGESCMRTHACTHARTHAHTHRSVSEGNEMAHSQAQIRLYSKRQNWASSKSTAQISREWSGGNFYHLSENIP